MERGNLKMDIQNISNDTNVEALKAENENLRKQVALLKESQDKIKKGVQSFLEKADAVQGIAQKTFNQNLLRLKVYELKLISYYNKLVQKYPIDEDLSNLSEFIEELKTVINKDFFSREDFELFSASRELGRQRMVTPEELVPNESGFDILEALHPDQDLEELCKELGLMTEE